MKRAEGEPNFWDGTGEFLSRMFEGRPFVQSIESNPEDLGSLANRPLRIEGHYYIQLAGTGLASAAAYSAAMLFVSRGSYWEASAALVVYAAETLIAGKVLFKALSEMD